MSVFKRMYTLKKKKKPHMHHAVMHCYCLHLWRPEVVQTHPAQRSPRGEQQAEESET